MSAPGYTLHGIQDNSIETGVYNAPVLATHTPLFMAMTKRGPVDPMLIGYDGFDIYYSLDSLGVDSPWHTHQSEFIQAAVSCANTTIMVKRIVDNYSQIAATKIGFIRTTDDANNVVNTIATSPVPQASPHVMEPDFAGEFFPLFEIWSADPGAWGNQVGVQIYVADDMTQKTVGAVVGATVYKAVCVQEDNQGNMQIINNLYGSSTTLFTMKPDSVYNDQDIFFDTIMTKMYIEDITALTRQAYFSKFKIHIDSAIALATATTPYYQQDLLTPLKTSANGAFQNNRPFYCQGGNDGFIDESTSTITNRLNKQQKYDEAVRSWLDSIDDTNAVIDMAKYPYSSVWDSGFTKETKLLFPNLQKYRKDVHLGMAVYSQFIYADSPTGVSTFSPASVLTTDELISLGTYYKTVFGSYAESEVYGTPTTRVTLHMQDGINRNSNYRKRQTLNLDLFQRVAKYCGGPSWKSAFAFDQDGYNTVTGWTGVNATYMPTSVKENAWDSGLIYVESNDINSYFYADYQTLYTNDSSPLNSVIFMLACCKIEQIHAQAWARVTGDSKHTNAQIADIVDKFISKEVTGLFDGRYQIVPKTTFTLNDIQAGFSFTTDTEVYSNITKIRANYKIIAHRMQ